MSLLLPLAVAFFFPAACDGERQNKLELKVLRLEERILDLEEDVGELETEVALLRASPTRAKSLMPKFKTE